MFARFLQSRKLRRWCLGFAGAALLAACVPSSGGLMPGGGRVGGGDPVPVALLVPKTGTSASLGATLENAARMAVDDLSGAEIALAVYDTTGTAAGAVEAARLAARNGAKIIVGPLFADAAAVAGAEVAGRGINVLSLSNNPAVAGGNIFILGNTFQDSANRIVSYAASRGLTDFAIVHADTAVEALARDALARAIGARGLRLAAVLSFPPSQNGIVTAAPGIVREIEASGATAVILTSGNDGALAYVAELLPGAGLDRSQVQVMGLQRMDLPPSARSLPGLQSAWFALPDPALAEQFSSRYQARYGLPPLPLTSLAYDAIAAVGQLVSTGQPAALSRAGLTQPSGFSGAGGVFRFGPNGVVERGLAVGQILNGQVVVLETAPRGFGTAGF